MRALRRTSPLLVYPLVAVLAFPTLTTLLQGTGAWAYTLDVFDDGGALPRLAIAVRDWSAFGPTLWDPWLTDGNAFLGQFALPPYSPDVILAFLVGPFWTLAITTWLTASLAGVGMHLFLRDSVRLSPLAVLTGAAMATLCYWHPIYGVSIAILPLVLWLGDRALIAQSEGSDPRRRWVAGWLLAATLALWAGQAQTAAFVAAIQLVWLLLAGPGSRRRRAGAWLATWVLALLLYGPVMVTQVILLPISQRTVWNHDYLSTIDLAAAARSAVDHYSSLFVGLPKLGTFSPNEPRYGTLYLGGIGAILILVAFAARRRDRATQFILGMLVVVPFLDLLAIAGRHLTEQIPVFESVQYVRIRHFYPFALAAAVALGIEAFTTADRAVLHRRRRWTLGVGALILAAIAIEAAVALRRSSSHLLHFADRPSDVGYVLVSLAMVAGLIGGVVLLVALFRGRSITVAPILAGLALLFVVDRAALSNGLPLLGRHISTFDTRLALTSGQAFMLEQPGIATERVLTFGDHANRMSFQGLRQVDGYQAIFPLAYHGFFGQMIAPGLDSNPSRWAYYHRWGARAYAFLPAVDPELVSLAGARWLYVVGDEVPTVPGIFERFHDGTITVYENPAAFPRAMLVAAVDVAPDQSSVLARLGDANEDDLRSRAYTTAAEVARTPGLATLRDAQPGTTGSVTVTSETPDHIELDVRADRPAVLVLLDASSPGWVAEVDGRRVPISQVDAAFRGIVVGPEARHAVIRYAPGFTYTGFIVAGVGAIASLGWVWFAGRHRRPEGSARDDVLPAPGRRTAVRTAVRPD